MRQDLKQLGWFKAIELVKVARRDGQRFESTTLVAQSAVVAQGTTLRPRLRNGNGLPVYLCDMGSMYLEIAIGTALDDATTKLGLLVGIVEIDDGERVRSPEHGPPLPPGHRKMRACWREATSILGTNRQKTRAKEIGRAVRKGPRWPAMLS